jgi:hypothetical protein
MGIVEALVVGGATATIVAGAAAVAVTGGWARRVATFALAAIAPSGGSRHGSAPG